MIKNKLNGIASWGASELVHDPVKTNPSDSGRFARCCHEANINQLSRGPRRYTTRRAQAEGSQPMSDDNNLTNIRNVLGFLLAGFGGLLSFLGVRSSEVSTILRNDSPQASVIALILLLGVLAAVSAITTQSKKKVSLASAAAMGVILFGVGALVIFAIPIGRNWLTISGWISLVIGCLLVLAGTSVLVRFPPYLVRRCPLSRVEQGVDLIDILILSSVLLTAIAAYGAIRLESKSQLSFSSQVGASFSINGSLATVSVDIAATKMPQADWVYVDIYAVPTGVNLMDMCESSRRERRPDHRDRAPPGNSY